MEENKTLEEQFRFVETKNNATKWFKKNMSMIILVGASILFIFKEGMQFSQSNQDILTLVMSMGFTYLFALYVSLSMRTMGKKSGKESNLFMNAMKYLSEAKQSIKDIMFLLPRYVRYKNEKTLEDVKKLFLEENGINYKLWKSGYYNKEENIKQFSEKQIKVMQEVHNIKITKLQVSDLLSEHSKSTLKHYDPLFLGKGENVDNAQATTSMLLSKAVLPIITSYFAVQVVLGIELLWGAIQVSIILLMGVTHYMEGEEYVMNELRNRQINKADLLNDFRTLYDNKKEIFADEEEELKAILQEA